MFDPISAVQGGQPRKSREEMNTGLTGMLALAWVQARTMPKSGMT